MNNKYIILYSDKPVFQLENTYKIDKIKEMTGKKFMNEFISSIATSSFDKENISVEPQEVRIAIEEVSPERALQMKLTDPHISDIFEAMPLTLVEPAGKRYYQPEKDPHPNVWGIDAVNAKQSQFNGKGVKVAILDTGIDISHPAFNEIRNRIKIENFTREHETDIRGHGTHCAGTLFGRDVNGVRIGIAPGIEDIYIGKVLGTGGSDVGTLIKAIEAAARFGAHIISMSLEIDFPGKVETCIRQNPKTDIKEIISIGLNVYQKNIRLLESRIAALQNEISADERGPLIIIAAAGNKSNRPYCDISVNAPAVSKGIISVGALQQTGSGYTVPTFSNKEPLLSAPGCNILSAVPKQNLAYDDGTSMAVPHVAGVAALWGQLLMQEGRFTDDMLKAHLLTSCKTNLLTAENKLYYGAGIVQAP